MAVQEPQPLGRVGFGPRLGLREPLQSFGPPGSSGLSGEEGKHLASGFGSDRRSPVPPLAFDLADPVPPRSFNVSMQRGAIRGLTLSGAGGFPS